MKPGGGGPLAVLKDKRVLIGAAAAGGLGLVVLLRRGGAPVDEPAGAVLSPSQLDSSGTDIYNALSQFTEGLEDIRDLLGQRPTTGTGADPVKNAPQLPATTDPVAPRPIAKPAAAAAAPKPKPLFVKVSKYTTKNAPWNSTLSGIAKHYGTSVTNLLRLNPSVKDKDLIRTGQQIRYR